VCDPGLVCGSQVAAVISGIADALPGGALRDAFVHPWGRPATEEEADDPTAGRELPPHLRGSDGDAATATPRFVSGMQDGSLMLWRAADGARERTWEGHGWGHAVRALAALPPGAVVSGSTDGTLRVWRLSDCSCVAQLSGHTDTVRCVLALPDGRVLSGADDSTLRLWSLADGTCEWLLTGHTAAVWALVALADGSGRVVSGAWDGQLRVWAPPGPGGGADGQASVAPPSACLRVLSGHTKAVHALCALPGSGARVVSGGADQTLRVWDCEAGTCDRTLDVGRGGVVHALAALGPDRVAAGSGDGALRVWAVGQAAPRCERVLKGHADGAFALALLPDGRVVSGSSDKSLCVWAAAQRERVLVPPVAAGATWALVALGPPPTRVLAEWEGPPPPAPTPKDAALTEVTARLCEEAAFVLDAQRGPQAEGPRGDDDGDDAMPSPPRRKY